MRQSKEQKDWDGSKKNASNPLVSTQECLIIVTLGTTHCCSRESHSCLASAKSSGVCVAFVG